MKKTRVIVGIMSGTSLDGADALAVAFHAPDARMEKLGAATLSFEPTLQRELLALSQGCDNEIERLGRASVALSRHYAAVVEKLFKDAGLDASRVDALAVHGQTVRHRPEAGFTLQIHSPALLAELTGIDVVADFRARDVAAGGQGAPLVPAFHKAVFEKASPCAILNVGGIANVTLLGGRTLKGFDTGPGNVLSDLWARRVLGAPCDVDGQLARKGRIDETLFARAMAEPYFALAPAKSTGRELFNDAWLDAKLEGLSVSDADVCRTLVEVTAAAAVDALRFAERAPAKLFVCGGGAFNPVLMEALAARFSGEVASTAALGLDPMDVEAAAFAWLGMRFLEGLPGNDPDVTGAKGPRILGALYPA